ncbi:hypothetical protein BS17DRAFT_257418 [Gyrodon lividus]|nr:hypothetical protein BS17DRAFT_257418 [Gyrodon lividus]
MSFPSCRTRDGIHYVMQYEVVYRVYICCTLFESSIPWNCQIWQVSVSTSVRIPPYVHHTQQYIPSLIMRRAIQDINLSSVERWFVWGTQRSVWILKGTRARCIEHLPRKLWGKIVLLMFTCCLVTFLRAFFGIGFVEEGTCTLKVTSIHSTPSSSDYSPTSHGNGLPSKECPGEGDRGRMQVMEDWHGDYELFPTGFIFSPASIPQDAFPDPTPALASLPKVDVVPYDPFRLDFRDVVEDGESHRIAEPPNTAKRSSTRRRQLARCLLADGCL